MRLLPRRRGVTVESFDAATGRWSEGDIARAVDRTELTLTTYNIWNDSKHAEQRYLAIAQLLSRRAPDVMVFQEMTQAALEVFLAQRWIREGYSRAAVVGGDAGDYGMLLLSRLPVTRVTYNHSVGAGCAAKSSRTRGCQRAKHADSCRPNSS